MSMIKRSGVGIVDSSDDEFREDEPVYWCRHCLEYNFKIPLRNRVYPDNEPIPVDHDQWRQCLECGLIVPVYELQKESEIKDVLDTVTNPFDLAKDSILGVDNRQTTKKKRRSRLKPDELDDIKDKTLKAELRKGSILLDYSEQMPQQS